MHSICNKQFMYNYQYVNCYVLKFFFEQSRDKQARPNSSVQSVYLGKVCTRTVCYIYYKEEHSPVQAEKETSLAELASCTYSLFTYYKQTEKGKGDKLEATKNNKNLLNKTFLLYFRENPQKKSRRM